MFFYIVNYYYIGYIFCLRMVSCEISSEIKLLCTVIVRESCYFSYFVYYRDKYLFVKINISE